MWRKRRRCLLLPAGLTVRRLMMSYGYCLLDSLEGPHTKILMDGFQLETCETKASDGELFPQLPHRSYPLGGDQWTGVVKDFVMCLLELLNLFCKISEDLYLLISLCIYIYNYIFF